MAFWGMDLTQSDDFCEAYDEYTDLYDNGLDPSAITQQMLEKYTKLYDTFENIPHNILFAIAKAEWTLGFRSEKIFSRVNEIIETGENIKYYCSLGFSENEINERNEKLLKFQKALHTPKETIKKRKISTFNKIKKLPKGTVSYYDADGGYFGFIVLDAVYRGRLIAITEKLPNTPESIEDILNSPVLTTIWLLLQYAPKGYNNIGNIEIKGNYNGRAGVFLCKPVEFGINFSFHLNECHRKGLTSFKGRKIKDLLDEKNVPIEFYNGENAEKEKQMVLELLKNPASKLATNMIKQATSLEDFYK